MRISIAQTKPHIGQVKNNGERILAYINEGLKEEVDLILFPEMAMPGYTFEAMDTVINDQNTLIHQIESLLENHDTKVIIGGLEKEESKYYLSQYVIGKTIETYRKIHIGKKESLYVSPGETMKVFKKNTFSFGIMMCYDTHFPELATQMALNGAQVIFAPSAVPNLPEKRVADWKKYLIARAYDNRVYVIANNLIFGERGGGTIAINPFGEVVFESVSLEEGLVSLDLKRFEFSKTGMKNRDFKMNRKPEIYNKIEIQEV